jgi:uncharacterized protein YxjI
VGREETDGMETFEVTQLLMAVGSVYQVRTPGSEDLLMTVKGSLMTPTPKFSMVKGADGAELATLTGNFIKTKFQIHAADKSELGALSFPAIAFKKTLVLTVGGRGYTADGGIMGGVFRCVDNEGVSALEISKKSGIRDKFEIAIKGNIAKEVGLLAAVAIHSRFFELM